MFRELWLNPVSRATSDLLMLLLLFVLCTRMKPLFFFWSHGSQRFYTLLRVPVCLVLTPHGTRTEGRVEVGFGLRPLQEPESCQQLWDTPLSETRVCVYTFEHVCVCVGTVSGPHVHSVFSSHYGSGSVVLKACGSPSSPSIRGFLQTVSESWAY